MSTGALDDDAQPARAATTPEAEPAQPKAPHSVGGEAVIRAPRARRGPLLVAVGVVATCELVGTAFSPALLTYSPLLLVALSPLPRHLVLAASNAPTVPLFVIALVRRLFACLLAFRVGARFGEPGLAWLEGRYPRLRTLVHRFERLFRRAGPLVLLVAPGPPLCALAGMTSMRAGRFLAAVTAGQALSVALAFWLADLLRPWTAQVLEWLREQVMTTTLVCVALVVAYRVVKWWMARRR